MRFFQFTSRKFSFKSKNVRTFLFFLGCTSLLWILIQFSKQYTQEMDVEVSFQNIPQGMLLNEGSHTKVPLLFHGNGFRLLRYAWSTPKVSLNISDALVIGDNQYSFLFEKQKAIVKKQLGFNGELTPIQNDTINVFLDERSEKKVPVIANVEIQYASGYGSGEGIQIFPDSVLVSGPKSSVDTLQSVSTSPIVWTALKTNFSEELPVLKQPIKMITYTPNQIQASVAVSKFTEGVLEISIQIRNTPTQKKIKIFPKKATVIYKVALHQYNAIRAEDFTIVADYNTRLEDRSFLTLKLVKAPSTLQDVRLREREVNYVLLK